MTYLGSPMIRLVSGAHSLGMYLLSNKSESYDNQHKIEKFTKN